MLKTVQDSLKKSPTTLKEIELKNQEVIAAQAEILISPLQIRGKFPRFLKAPLAAGLCEEMRKWGNDNKLGLFVSGFLISSFTNCQPFAWDSNLNEPIRPICRWPQFILRKLKLASNLGHGADLPYPARRLPSSAGSCGEMRKWGNENFFWQLHRRDSYFALTNSWKLSTIP